MYNQHSPLYYDAIPEQERSWDIRNQISDSWFETSDQPNYSRKQSLLQLQGCKKGKLLDEYSYQGSLQRNYSRVERPAESLDQSRGYSKLSDHKIDPAKINFSYERSQCHPKINLPMQKNLR